MSWTRLPGPATFLQGMLEELRDGNSVVVGAATQAQPELERAMADFLIQNRWAVQSIQYSGSADPLQFITDERYIEPDTWIGWNASRLVEHLSPGELIFIEGVSASAWPQWRLFLTQLDNACRAKPSDERPQLVLLIRGVPRTQLGLSTVTISLRIWSGVINELDVMSHVDQLLRARSSTLPRHHKLLVRQIAGLALWDLPLAEALCQSPTSELFSPKSVLQTIRESLDCRVIPTGPEWHQGGIESFDCQELRHPFLLLENGDQSGEITQRIWAAQASVLLPLIEIRRRELASLLERHIRPLPEIDGVQIGSLEDLEIGSLAYWARARKVPQPLTDLANRLACHRNALAHLKTLGSTEALDPRLYGSRPAQR